MLVIGPIDRGWASSPEVGRGRETDACCGRAQSSVRWGPLVISCVTKGWQVSFFLKSWMSFLLFLLCSFGALVTSTIGFIRMDFYYSLLFSGTTASLIDLSWPACVQYDVLMITIDNEFQVAYKYGFILSYSLCFSSYSLCFSSVWSILL